MAELSGYQRRCLQQALSWAYGTPMHNSLDNECCPDFSCCNPEMFIADSMKRGEILNELLERYGVIQ